MGKCRCRRGPSIFDGIIIAALACGGGYYLYENYMKHIFYPCPSGCICAFCLAKKSSRC
ncbi:unnamed protein product [Phyllotreta striolata]|uniref:Uncharacterized protein n=1 Tax=Phyllotreta striolata TaxID=444603 RepID=A0A9N9XL08_PHYSR|nr:unnamed protein product [Phyllotreta striolata]